MVDLSERIAVVNHAVGHNETTLLHRGHIHVMESGMYSDSVVLPSRRGAV